MAVLENVCGFLFGLGLWRVGWQPWCTEDFRPYRTCIVVPDTYLQVLPWLYADPAGNVGGNRFLCNITRGVKQIDVLNPMLFNSGLEHAMQNWKQFLKSRWCFQQTRWCFPQTGKCPSCKRSFVIRNFLGKNVGMLELPVVELNRVSLHFNTSETKLLTIS